MKYKKTLRGKFISRPNRFIASVMVRENVETVHVKNTGRCKELLTPGACVVLSVSDNENRRTKYDLIAVEKVLENGEKVLINMDSQIPNDVAYEWLKSGGLISESALVRREVKYGNSRFDIYFEDGEKKGFIEVKGVTLESGGVAMFPDAPTDRGVKHLKELSCAKSEGYEAYVLFVIQMKGVRKFVPNDETDKAFGSALRAAKERGVEILVYDCKVEDDFIEIDSPVEYML